MLYSHAEQMIAAQTHPLHSQTESTTRHNGRQAKHGSKMSIKLK